MNILCRKCEPLHVFSAVAIALARTHLSKVDASQLKYDRDQRTNLNSLSMGAQIDLEATFAEFVRAHGDEVVADIVGQSPDFFNADYLLRGRTEYFGGVGCSRVATSVPSARGTRRKGAWAPPAPTYCRCVQRLWYPAL